MNKIKHSIILMRLTAGVFCSFLTTTQVQASEVSYNVQNSDTIFVPGTFDEMYQQVKPNVVKTLVDNQKQQSKVVSYYMDKTLPQGFKDDASNGMLSWNQAAGFEFVPVSSKDDANIVFSGTSTDGNLGKYIEHADGVTQVVKHHADKGHDIIDQAVIKVNFDQLTKDESTITGTRIYEHEIGHALGLQHHIDSSTDSIMADSAGWVDITSNDVAAINQMYK